MPKIGFVGAPPINAYSIEADAIMPIFFITVMTGGFDEGFSFSKIHKLLCKTKAST